MGRIHKGGGRLVSAEVLSAREEATRRLAEVAAVEEAARRRGFHEGLRDGREAGLAETTAILAAAQTEAERLRGASADVALALACKMAEKIVGRAIELDPRVLVDVVTQALAASRVASGRLTVRLHPEELAALEASRPDLAARAGAAIDLRFVADENVGRGGCVVETPMGRVDARLATQLDALARALSGR